MAAPTRLRSAVGLLMVAGTSALAADAADDLLVFRAVTDQAEALVADHPGVQAALGGPPCTRGSLWSTTLSAPYKSHLARATFDVAGPAGVRTEVSVLAARKGAGERGSGPPPFWRRWSPDGWALLDVRAALPGGAAGPVRGVSLLPARPPPPAQAPPHAPAGEGKAGGRQSEKK